MLTEGCGAFRYSCFLPKILLRYGVASQCHFLIYYKLIKNFVRVGRVDLPKSCFLVGTYVYN